MGRPFDPGEGAVCARVRWCRLQAVGAVMIVVSDEEMDRRVRELVNELRRALQEAALVARDVRTFRRVLAGIGAQAQELALAGESGLSNGESVVEPWPTHDEFCGVLRLDRQLRERIDHLRGDLRRLGIGPDLFE